MHAYSAASTSRITAVLGPTNTGKTYLAMERLMGYSSGIMGFPLRLLARENYDRLVAIKGANKVALVTGEEKILPKSPQYWICTVESMPIDLKVDFIAVDEIQLCGDPERGHIFTDRLLNARGRFETMFLGAETIRGVIEDLIDEVEFITRPRLSTLTYIAPKKLTRIPSRSAVVVFSANQVYRVAEQIRQHRGGAAVVLGALSPRTRNAQVAMYQAGEVDYLVATDAIGMGLNMDIDHVTFSAMKKFDGRGQRFLQPQEIGQIAGRAGRHMNDGTFCAAADIREPSEDLVEAVENHRYDPLEYVFWRRANLDYRSIHHLRQSLDDVPYSRRLQRSRETEDLRALTTLGQDPELQKFATSPAAVRTLWDICQIPDFHKSFTDTHIQLQARIYKDLMGSRGSIDTDYVQKQVSRLDDVEGNIDALVNRIANIRTWTYISHRADWMPDPKHWQSRTRTIEDRLSDALHDRLTNQFVDRRAAILVKRLKEGGELLSGVQADGSVVVEGEFVGKIKGFHFEPDETVDGPEGKTLLTAARKALKQEIIKRLEQFHADNDGAFSLGDEGTIDWRGAPIAILTKGQSLLTPDVKMQMGELVDVTAAKSCEERVKAWLSAHLKNALGLIESLKDLEGSAAVRAIGYQLWEGLGTIERAPVRDTIKTLTPDERAKMRKAGVRFGRKFLFVPAVKQPRTQRVLGLMAKAHGLDSLPLNAQGKVDIGRRPGDVVVTVDLVERALNRMWRQENEEAAQKSETNKSEKGKNASASVGEIEIADIISVKISPVPEATAPAVEKKSNKVLLAEVRADLLEMTEGEQRQVDALMALPEAKRFTPRHRGPNNKGSTNRDGAAKDGSQKKADGKRPQAKGKPKTDGKKKPAKGDRRGKSNQRDSNREHFVDKTSKRLPEESPFAALAQLKKNMKS